MPAEVEPSLNATPVFPVMVLPMMVAVPLAPTSTA